MADGIMMEIAALENEMEVLEKQAVSDARIRVIEARNQAEALLERTKTEIETDLKNRLASNEQKLTLKMRDERLILEKLYNELKTQAEGRIELASRFILEMIVVNNGRY